MDNYIILDKKKNSKKILNIIEQLGLHKCLKNKRTTVWENDNLQISIDKTIIRILIYSHDDVEHYRSIFTNGD